MEFVAIDFETANEKRASACSCGIAIVAGGRVVETKHWLIRPQELRFSPWNVGIHGICIAQGLWESRCERLLW